MTGDFVGERATDSAWQVMTIRPRAVDYAHLVGRYVRMERPPTQEEIRENPELEAVGMECVVAQVNDVHNGAEVVADYGYGFVISVDDAADWCFHIWPDKDTRELFATRAPVGVGDGRSIPAGVKAEFAEIENTLAKALGYQWDERYGFAVGDHTPYTLAREAARKIEELTSELTEAVQAGGIVEED